MIKPRSELASSFADEVVAFDLGSKKILPFQTLTTRAKKNVSADSIQVYRQESQEQYCNTMVVPWKSREKT